MTKNRSMKIAVLVLALALLTSCFIGSTFAKYTSTGAGIAEATVAKWSFKVNTVDIATTDEFTFDLFQDGYVDTGVNGEKLAPGTTGQFAIALENTSDVWATYTIALSDGDDDDSKLLAGVPLEFTTDNSDDDSWKTIDTFTISAANLTYDTTADANKTSVTVYWRWVFNGNDNTDTTLGITPPTVKVKATVTATQLDVAPTP